MLLPLRSSASSQPTHALAPPAIFLQSKQKISKIFFKTSFKNKILKSVWLFSNKKLDIQFAIFKKKNN